MQDNLSPEKHIDRSFSDIQDAKKYMDDFSFPK